jgi:hypothetical protein
VGCLVVTRWGVEEMLDCYAPRGERVLGLDEDAEFAGRTAQVWVARCCATRGEWSGCRERARADATPRCTTRRSARGTVGGPVSDFLARSVPHAGDFVRTQEGGCRLHPQRARAVVATCRVGQAQINEHARWVRELLLAE